MPSALPTFDVAGLFGEIDRVVPAVQIEVLLLQGGRLQALGAASGPHTLRAALLLSRVHSRLDARRDYVAPGIPASRTIPGNSTAGRGPLLTVPILSAGEAIGAVLVEGTEDRLTLGHVAKVARVVQRWLPELRACAGAPAAPAG